MEDNPYGTSPADAERPPALKALGTDRRVVYPLADEPGKLKSMLTVSTPALSRVVAANAGLKVTAAHTRLRGPAWHCGRGAASAIAAVTACSPDPVTTAIADGHAGALLNMMQSEWCFHIREPVVP